MINRPMSKYLKNLTKKIVSGASGFQKLVKENVSRATTPALCVAITIGQKYLNIKHMYT